MKVSRYIIALAVLLMLAGAFLPAGASACNMSDNGHAGVMTSGHAHGGMDMDMAKAMAMDDEGSTADESSCDVPDSCTCSMACSIACIVTQPDVNGSIDAVVSSVAMPDVAAPQQYPSTLFQPPRLS